MKDMAAQLEISNAAEGVMIFFTISNVSYF